MDRPKLTVSMPGFIVTILLAYFGVALFGKSLGIAVDDTSPLAQTLINVTIAATSYFIGTSQGSAKKDEVIAGHATPPADPGTTPKDVP